MFIRFVQKIILALGVAFSLLASSAVVSQVINAHSLPVQQSPRYLADIRVNTKAELTQLLRRAESLFDQGKFNAGKDQPVAFVLHGPEARSLLVENYSTNKVLVDLAARLTAFQVVDIQVCEGWMKSRGVEKDDLPPFIGSVSLGPVEKKRLIKEEGYVYF